MPAMHGEYHLSSTAEELFLKQVVEKPFTCQGLLGTE